MDAQEMKQFKETAEQLGKAAADLKEMNEQTGKTVGEVKSSVDKVNDRIDGIEEKMSAMREAEAKSNRPAFGGTAGEAEEYKQEFVDVFMRKGREDGLQAKAGSLSVPGDGGLLVPESIDTEISKILNDEVVMRDECRVIQVGSEEYKKLVRTVGATGGWVGETDARPATNSPNWAKLGGTFGEVYANPQITQAMLDDVMYDVEGDLVIDLAEEFAEMEEAAFTTGNGVNKPKGLFAHTMSTAGDDSRTFGEIQKIASSAVGSFTSDDLIDIEMTLKKKHRKNAKWMMSNNALRIARKLKDSDGNYLWVPGLSMGQESTLLGYMVAENEEMPDVAAGALSIGFADFKRAYYILDRMGTGMLRDPYTNKPFVGFYTTKRVGGMLHDSNAVKVMEIAAA